MPVAPDELPFRAAPGAEGLTFTYVDEEGTHVVQDPLEVPEAQRELVRISSLRVPPERRLDPRHVYVANLAAPREDGSFPVARMTRRSFDALVDEATGADVPAVTEAPPPPPAGSDEIIIYGASWCGACRATARFLRGEGVAFTERDIEREPGAREEMMRKARAAGVSTNGIPVIDFRGTILNGFDERAMRRLLRGG